MWIEGEPALSSTFDSSCFEFSNPPCDTEDIDIEFSSIVSIAELWISYPDALGVFKAKLIIKL